MQFKLSKDTMARLLIRCGISANFLTVLGLALALTSAFLIYRGLFLGAAGLLLLSGLLDLLDGAVARASKMAGPFGGILDSSLDRYGDGFVYSGIIFYYCRHSQIIYVLLALSALLGSFLISYVRARAECEIDNCRVGFWERGERTVYIALALLFNNLGMAILVLGIATHFTALQRIYFSYEQSLSAASRKRSRSLFRGTEPNRSSSLYLLKAGFLFLLLLVRIN